MKRAFQKIRIQENDYSRARMYRSEEPAGSMGIGMSELSLSKCDL